MADEHGDPRAVLAAIKNLLRDIVARLKIDLRLPENGALPLGHVVAIDRGGRREAAEGVGRLAIGSLSLEAGRRADTGQIDVAQMLTAQVVHAHQTLRI